MKIYFHRFTLNPLKPLNRFSREETREGVFLKSDSANGIGMCEYFPHRELEDPAVDEFLETFSEGRFIVQQKALYLLNPYWIRQSASKSFHNHSFSESGMVVKYKLKDEKDYSFINQFDKVERYRLDANGLFTDESWKIFYQGLPHEVKVKIEYVEDPLSTVDWSSIKTPCAQDFIKGGPAQLIILKPYRDFYPDTDKTVIFSGNMGHGLSNFQTYLELLDKGNLDLYHGILTPHLYENVPELFVRTRDNQFQPDTKAINDYINHLSSMEWSHLCTII